MAYFSYYGNNTTMEIANVNGGGYNDNATLLSGILLLLMNGDRGGCHTCGRTGVPHCSCGGCVPKLICDALGTWRCMMGCHD